MAPALLLAAALAAASSLPGEKPVMGPVRRLDGRILSAAEVTATADRLVKAGRVTGLGLAILNQGRVVYLNSFGRRNVEQQLSLTPSSTMYAASFTKAMFATLVMQLADEKIIDLDASIATCLKKPLPDYEKYKDLKSDSRWRMWTPRMLLAHTSGLPNFRFIKADGGLDFDQPLRIEREPGSRYGYSGEGINLLQFVLEAGLGLDVGELMRTRVFDRFFMSRTSMKWRDDFAADLALGYDEAGVVIGHNQRNSVRAAGSADSTIADMGRFMGALLRGETSSKRTRRAMLTPQLRIRSLYQFPTLLDETTTRDDRVQLSAGLGVLLLKTPYGPAFLKEGHDDGWENYMIGFEKSKTGIVIMTNSSNGESIFKELLEMLIGDTFTPWEWERYTPYDATPAAR